MNRQLSALTDEQLAAFDGGDDLTPGTPTPEMYAVALERLANMHQATVPGDDDYNDLHLDICDGTVALAQNGQWIFLSPEMLQSAADWVRGRWLLEAR
jgi:hypothetical protein